MTDDTTSQYRYATRDDALRSLERLLGTWTITGSDDLHGEVRFEWMQGGRFLVQHVDLHQHGQHNRGIEYIGYDADRGVLASHYFGAGGDVLEYTWHVDDRTLRIWFGDLDSPAHFVGTFSDDGAANAGRWAWPGGGYDSTMRRSS